MTHRNLSIDEIYQAMETIHQSGVQSPSAEIIFESIESHFSSFDSIHAQNFLNFLVEEFSLFTNISKIFERTMALANILNQSDQISSKSVAYASLTKLWLHVPGQPQGLTDFINHLMKVNSDNDFPPHLKTICSHCLNEIYLAHPNLITATPAQLLEAASNNPVPTAFQEIAFSKSLNDKKEFLTPDDEKNFTEFYNRRSIAMCPFEISSFAPPLPLNCLTPPNDPILIHSALASGRMKKEEALQLLSNPLSAFGVPSVVLEFKDLSFDGKEIFSDFDTDEQVAAKAHLLIPTLSSILDNPQLANFDTLSRQNPIVKAVFDIASRFTVAELFTFFQNYFAKTKDFDQYWTSLYHSYEGPNKAQAQKTLRCFLSQFPNRQSTAEILLSQEDEKPPLSVIDSLNSPEQLKKVSVSRGSVEGLFVESKLSQFPSSGPQVSQQIETLQPLIESQPFSIVAKDIRTVNLNQMTIRLSIESSITEATYGVNFTLSNNQYFEEDCEVTVPVFSKSAVVEFKMKPIKVGKAVLKAFVAYTMANGKTGFAVLPDVQIMPHEFLSPAPNDIDFDSVWKEGEESRIVLSQKYQQLVTFLGATVFAGKPTADGMKVVLSTPDQKTIAIHIVGIQNGSVAQFKAPDLDLLSIIDDFLRSIPI